MDARDVLLDTFTRLREAYVGTAEGLDTERAHWRPGGTGNSITWLLWHVARVQDDHFAGLSGGTQAWHDGWAERFSFPFDPGDIGFGHSSDEVDTVRVERLEDLVDYHAAVHQLGLAYLDRADADELDRIVDRNWDPPVTAGVRLVSLIGDTAMHLGQADYVKGLPLDAGRGAEP